MGALGPSHGAAPFHRAEWYVALAYFPDTALFRVVVGCWALSVYFDLRVLGLGKAVAPATLHKFIPWASEGSS